MSKEIEAIKKISDVENKKIGGVGQQIEPNREQFQQMMAEKASKTDQVEYSRQHQERARDAEKVRQDQASKNASPIEEMSNNQRRVANIEKLDKARYKRLVSQTESAKEMLARAKEDLASPNVKLHRSTQRLMRNKLSHVDESLKVALTTVGADYIPPTAPEGLATPVQKFLGYLTHSQSQLETLGGFISKLESDAEGKTLHPAQMLTLQLKVGFIQQEVELFVSLLNKSLESVKTLMNVQI